ncbi:MAG: hypothetical protein AB7G93_23445 [Bdellovibrionales bacterium]
MRRILIPVILAISIGVAPARSQAQFGGGMEIFTYLPLIFAVIVLIQASQVQRPSSLPFRQLGKVHLASPLEDGEHSIAPEEAARILTGRTSRTDRERLIVANSVMARVFTKGFWIDRTSTFETLNVSAGTPSLFVIKNELLNVFRSHGLRPSSIQNNLVDLLSAAWEFEIAIRSLGIRPDVERTGYLAAYLQALSASIYKANRSKRTELTSGVITALAELNQSLFQDVGEVLNNQDLTLKQNRRYQQLRLMSLRYMPPWIAGTYTGMLTTLASVVAFMIYDQEIIRMFEALNMGRMNAGLAGLLSAMFGVPTLSGVGTAFGYRSVMEWLLKPKVGRAATLVLQKACREILDPAGEDGEAP